MRFLSWKGLQSLFPTLVRRLQAGQCLPIIVLENPKDLCVSIRFLACQGICGPRGHMQCPSSMSNSRHISPWNSMEVYPSLLLSSSSGPLLPLVLLRPMRPHAEVHSSSFIFHHYSLIVSRSVDGSRNDGNSHHSSNHVLGFPMALDKTLVKSAISTYNSSLSV